MGEVGDGRAIDDARHELVRRQGDAECPQCRDLLDEAVVNGLQAELGREVGLVDGEQPVALGEERPHLGHRRLGVVDALTLPLAARRVGAGVETEPPPRRRRRSEQREDTVGREVAEARMAGPQDRPHRGAVGVQLGRRVRSSAPGRLGGVGEFVGEDHDLVERPPSGARVVVRDVVAVCDGAGAVLSCDVRRIAVAVDATSSSVM